jgi:hypothetical protein
LPESFPTLSENFLTELETFLIFRGSSFAGKEALPAAKSQDRRGHSNAAFAL